MPSSQDTANSFMSAGRSGGEPVSTSSPLDVCYPQNEMVSMGFDLQGRTPMVPPMVDYDPKPENLNPRSLAGQTTKHDAEGK